MILIVGLGNPDKKYEKTRHNVGFLALDSLVKNKDWKKSKNADCLYTKVQMFNKNIEFIKPLTFMNNSGKCVRYIKRKHSINLKDIIIIHDDIDLKLGIVKVSKNAGSAGHKGVQSIINELGTKDFTRIRIGIKPNFDVDTEIFVLKKFSKKEKEIIEKVIEEVIEIIQNNLE